MAAAERQPHVLFLCTGNAARSVMGGAVLSHLTDAVRVTTAGTHVIEGQPMSWRTRDALGAIGVDVPLHRSRQIVDDQLADVDLVVAFAAEHVRYVRRRHPNAADRTATIKRLCRDLPATEGALADRVQSLQLADVELEPWEELDDPAGGDAEVFVTTAQQVRELVSELAAAILPDGDRR